jgi:hypothetical protein
MALLHVPYTAWHLAYVAIGAALADQLHWTRLGGTLLAFAIGLGVGAHALDELSGRPLGTRFSDRTLAALGVGGLAAALGLGVVGAAIISPWILAIALLGVLLAAAYALEWIRWLHTDLGFAVTWGAFPVLVAYWAQTLTVSLSVGFVALAAVLLSLVQRALSTPARYVRRRTQHAAVEFDTGQPGWDKENLLVTWERPLRLLVATIVVLALALLARHL